ncbi:MAG TPA: O-antigen ligase family protein [Nautiliaceae bacterium]|nr:O-antigen ligase family protein [Nautiliaceae bacterium]
MNIKLKSINFDKINTFFLLMFAFFLPLSRALNSFFVIYFSIIFLLNVGKKELLKKYLNNYLFWTIVLFILYLTISLLWSEDKIKGISTLKYYWQWIAIFGIALVVSLKPEKIKSVISAFIFGMLVSEILSYGMFFEIWHINGKGADEPSPYMMHIDYSVFLAFTAMILLNRCFSHNYSHKEKILIAIFFITVVGNLFINKGRTGQLSFLIAIFISFFLHYRVSLKNFIIISLFAIFIFGIAYNVSNHFKTRVNAGIVDIQKILEGQYYTSVGLRVAQYFIVKDLFQENPLFGTGIGGRDTSVKELFERNNYAFSDPTKNFLATNHSHNQYLQIIIENGLIGFILMLLVLYNLFKLKIKDPELNELKIIFVTIYIVAFIAEPLWLKQFTNVLFILFTGLFLGASLSESMKKEKGKEKNEI